MSRFTIAFVLIVVLLSSEVAAASTPVSWWLSVPQGEPLDVVEVGPTGLIVTDVWISDDSANAVTLCEGGSLKYRQEFESDIRGPFGPDTPLLESGLLGPVRLVPVE